MIMPVEEATKFQGGPDDDDIMRTAVTKNRQQTIPSGYISDTLLGAFYVQTCHLNNLISRHYHYPHLTDEENEISEIQ